MQSAQQSVGRDAGGISSDPQQLLDRVGALVDRLGVLAGASTTSGSAKGASTSSSSAADGSAAAPDGDRILAMMQQVFGVSGISSLQLDFDYSHVAMSQAEMQSSGGNSDGSGSAWHSRILAAEGTAFSGKGTFTTDDGATYAFTIDYRSLSAVVADASGGAATSPAGDTAPSTAPAASTAPAWSLATALPSASDAAARTWLEQIEALLGLDDADGGRSASDAADGHATAAVAAPAETAAPAGAVATAS